MTVITEPIADIAGLGERQKVTIWTGALRENDSGTGTVTTRKHEITPVNGVLTTPNLDPGPARVRLGGVMDPIDITIPDSASPIRLWPLIDAAIGAPPPAATGFVKDGGNVARIQALTQAQYSALTTPDPATLYIIIE